MNLKFTKREKVIALILVIGVIAFFMRECSTRKEQDKLVNEIATYSDSAKYYKVKVDGMEVDVAFNKTLAVNTQEQMASLIAKNDTLSKLMKKFSEVSNTTIVNQYTTINNDTIALKGDSIPCDFKPIRVSRDSSHYFFVGTIAPTFFSIDTLRIPNKQSILTGTKKVGLGKGTEGLLKNKEKRVEIINSNPLVKITGLESYVVEDTRKFYEKGWFQILIGFGGGFYISQKIK